MDKQHWDLTPCNTNPIEGSHAKDNQVNTVFSNSPGPGKGKGKGQAEELAASVVPLVKRKRGRPPKDRNKIVAAPVPVTASRLISPAPVAGPSQHIADADTAASASTSASANASQGTLTSRPATRWVQRGRLAASSSSRAPPRQKDDLESEDEDDEEDEDQPAAETVKVAEPEPALEPAPEPALLTEPTGGEKIWISCFDPQLLSLLDQSSRR
ncbi:hypothetical protein B0H11DRAFT_2185746 [Mycena galericulata]|nr:hypothetical protein B0H11DRAFT_2185746 [Mycena galericulata]